MFSFYLLLKMGVILRSLLRFTVPSLRLQGACAPSLLEYGVSTLPVIKNHMAFAIDFSPWFLKLKKYPTTCCDWNFLFLQQLLKLRQQKYYLQAFRYTDLAFRGKNHKVRAKLSFSAIRNLQFH